MAMDLPSKLEKLVDAKVAELTKRELGGPQKRQWLTEHRLLSGQEFPLGRSEGSTKFGVAPGVIRSRGESGYSVLRIVDALMRGDPGRAPYEFGLSAKLENAGYQPSQPGKSIMMPWDGGDLFYRVPGREEVIEDLATEVKQALPFVTGDEAEARWLQQKTGAAGAGKAMDPNDDTLGGSTILFPAQGASIQLLRPNPVIQRAGAQIVPLPTQGSLYYPRESGDPTFTWLAPNSPIPDSTSLTGFVTLAAKRAAALVIMPNDLVRYSGGAAESLVRVGLMRRAELTEDLAALEGTGGTGQPMGISRLPRSDNDTPTKDLVTLHNAATSGGTGDTFGASDVLKMLALIEEAPDPDGATAWIMRPLLFSGLANLRADQGGGAGTGAFLFPITRGALGGAVEKVMSGIPVFTSTQVSKTRVKGGGTGLTYILAGNFQRALLGRVGAIELMMSQDYAFASDQIALRAILRGDFGVTWAQSFCIADQLVIPS